MALIWSSFKRQPLTLISTPAALWALSEYVSCPPNISVSFEISVMRQFLAMMGVKVVSIQEILSGTVKPA